MHIESAGETGPRVLLVHGSLAPGWATWEAQRPLAADHRLLVVHRGGYPPNSPLARIDFAEQASEIAELIEPGTHLVGHSYGGVISLLAAAQAGERLRSLTVIEPPAFGLVRGHPAVEDLITRLQAAFADAGITPRDFLARFAAAVGSSVAVPETLSPTLEGSVRATMVERRPWEAEIPFEAIRAGGFGVLVVSGGHDITYDLVCDVLTERLGARRAVIAGARHSVQRTGAPFNELLTSFTG